MSEKCPKKWQGECPRRLSRGGCYMATHHLFYPSTVYETPFKKDHFSLDKAGKISAITINSMHYILTVSIDKPQYLIFSEGYSPYWVLKKSQETIPSRKTKNGLNSFWLDQKGKYKVEISFSLEKFYNYGRIISLVTFLTVIFFVLLYFLRKKY